METCIQYRVLYRMRKERTDDNNHSNNPKHDTNLYSIVLYYTALNCSVSCNVICHGM